MGMTLESLPVSPTIRALLVIGVLLAACPEASTQTPISPSPDQQGTERIRGRVVAADTGVPLRGARVGAWPGGSQSARETTTDEDGRYEFGQLPAGASRPHAAARCRSLRPSVPPSW
jgi:hypothetical protein